MRFKFKMERNYIEVLPSFSIGWYGGFVIYFGWLFWNIIIEKK